MLKKKFIFEIRVFEARIKDVKLYIFLRKMKVSY